MCAPGVAAWPGRGKKLPGSCRLFVRAASGLHTRITGADCSSSMQGVLSSLGGALPRTSRWGRRCTTCWCSAAGCVWLDHIVDAAVINLVKACSSVCSCVHHQQRPIMPWFLQFTVFSQKAIEAYLVTACSSTFLSCAASAASCSTLSAAASSRGEPSPRAG